MICNVGDGWWGWQIVWLVKQKQCRSQFFLASLSIWLDNVRFASISIPRDLVVVTCFMFEPLTVRVGDAVGMLRFCLEPISVNSVLVTFRESLNASSASMVPLFQGNKLAFLAYRYIHPSPTLKTKQNRGEKEGSRRLFVVFFFSFTGRIRMYTCYTFQTKT